VLIIDCHSHPSLFRFAFQHLAIDEIAAGVLLESIDRRTILKIAATWNRRRPITMMLDSRSYRLPRALCARNEPTAVSAVDLHDPFFSHEQGAAALAKIERRV